MLEQRQESQSISGLITRKDTDELTTGVFILRVLPQKKKLFVQNNKADKQWEKKRSRDLNNPTEQKNRTKMLRVKNVFFDETELCKEKVIFNVKLKHSGGDYWVGSQLLCCFIKKIYTIVEEKWLRWALVGVALEKCLIIVKFFTIQCKSKILMWYIGE